MARRKKEPQNVHRKAISTVAEQLFMKKGIEHTSMNDIAKEAGYSKATLYVYFKNKEELLGVLVLESMQKLYDYIQMALEQSECTKERYRKICQALVKYQEEYPFYFKMVLETINIDFKEYQYKVTNISFDEIDLASIKDGVYDGEYDAGYIYARVEVEIREGQIISIHLVEHRNEQGKEAESILEDVVANQKIDVDAVSGATNSSKVIKKAIENALKETQ